MIDFKAIIFGTIATTILFLTNQLIFILVAAYSGLAGIESPFWNEYKDILWQAMGIATLGLSMFVGGGLMRYLVDQHQALHGLIVGSIISLFFAWTSADRGEINITGLVVFSAGALCCALGAHRSPWPQRK